MNVSTFNTSVIKKAAADFTCKNINNNNATAWFAVMDVQLQLKMKEEEDLQFANL